jgi:hypothetical protein
MATIGVSEMAGSKKAHPPKRLKGGSREESIREMIDRDETAQVMPKIGNQGDIILGLEKIRGTDLELIIRGDNNTTRFKRLG